MKSLSAPHVEELRELPGLTTALTGITAAVVGVILNLAIWFAWHVLVPAGGSFDHFVAMLAIGAWLAIAHFKIGVIPTLGVPEEGLSSIAALPTPISPPPGVTINLDFAGGGP